MSDFRIVQDKPRSNEYYPYIIEEFRRPAELGRSKAWLNHVGVNCWDVPRGAKLSFSWSDLRFRYRFNNITDAEQYILSVLAVRAEKQQWYEDNKPRVICYVPPEA